MMQSIKRFSWLVLLAFGLQGAWAFTPMIPVGFGPDAWQTPNLGYNPDGYLGDTLGTGPANLGDEYRRNTPVLYYSYDANFLGFFGSDGVAAVDSAFGILNSLTNVDYYSQGLTEFPEYSQQNNYAAQAAALLDLKSVTLTSLVLQLGLEDPERYVWTLHDAYLPGGGKCPLDEEFEVVQRNYDDYDFDVGSSFYSPYINGTLFTYDIFEWPGCKNPGVPYNFLTENYPVDPYAQLYSAVASDGLDLGSFYNGLTRDDVACLRYDLTTNNINIESPAAGSQLVTTNFNPNVLVITQPISLLTSAATEDPATVGALIPGLVVATTTNYFAVVITTNITAYYTNYPGQTVTNYAGPFGPQFLTTMDLGLFSAQALTNPPAALQALYPGLVIVSAQPYPVVITNWNIVVSLQPWIGGPAGSYQIVTTSNQAPYSYVVDYNYVFGNIYTNHYTTNNFAVVQNTYVTNLIGAPAGSPLVSKTITTTNKVHTPGGDFFILNTNWCGFKIDLTLWSQTLTSSSNTMVYGTTNSYGAAFLTNTVITLYTNYAYWIEQGFCEPALAFATNYTTNIVTAFQNTFGNVITNSWYSNTVETVITTNIGPFQGGVTNTTSTNITTNTLILTNVPSGDFWIEPPAWCGYSIVSDLQSNGVFTTNTLIATNAPGIADVGQIFSQTTYEYYTNNAFVITPLTCTFTVDAARLREGIENIQFMKASYDSLVGQFFQPITNLYTMTAVTNSRAFIQHFQRVVTAPDILLSAGDISGNLPNFNTFEQNTPNFNTASVPPGEAGPGTIDTPTKFTYNSAAPIYLNYGLLNTNSLLSELTQSAMLAWGSFDGSTNPPVVYPSGSSIQNLQNQILLQIQPPPPTLPDGTNNVAYPATIFATSGGGAFSPPFTWTVPGAGLPQGLSIVSNPDNTATLSGTPTNNIPGTFDFTLQLNDSLTPPRTVQWNYSITIH